VAAISGLVHAAEPTQAYVITFWVDHDDAVAQPDQTLGDQARQHGTCSAGVAGDQDVQL
jgi:hypothetical protein